MKRLVDIDEGVLGRARARAMGISVHTLRNWDQGRHPEGPAIALLRIAARHPRIIRENALSPPPERGSSRFSALLLELDPARVGQGS